MSELFRFKWQAMDPASFIKVSLGLLVMMALESLTGETWLATALVALLAWLADVPGPLRSRNGGILAFAAAAVVVTLLSGLIGLDLWPNVVAIAVVGLVGTLLLVWGTRAFMVAGY